MIRFTVRLEKDIYTKLERLAKAHYRSKVGAIRFLIKQAGEQNSKDHGEKENESTS